MSGSGEAQAGLSFSIVAAFLKEYPGDELRVFTFIVLSGAIMACAC
jgi:hypothetical protein